MDTKGAQALKERIAAQQHWAQAPAVRDGLQPSADPDADTLEETGDGYRLYAGGLRKELRDGRWEIVAG